jgi:hypothetical protein
VSRAKRPPKLETRVADAPATPTPTIEKLLERARVAGAGASGPSPNELRRAVDRIVAGDRSALGALAPMPGLGAIEVWSAITEIFGATADAAVIDATRTVAALQAATARVRAVAVAGGRIAVATARPASLLTLHLAFARVAAALGADVCDLADFGPMRADGRAARSLRWIGDVAVVTDGDALCATHDAGVGEEWMFAIRRPTLAITDGPFAQVALEHGVEVVALAGLDQVPLAVAARRDGRAIVVPVHTDRPSRAYRVLEACVLEALLDGAGGAAGQVTALSDVEL